MYLVCACATGIHSTQRLPNPTGTFVSSRQIPDLQAHHRTARVLIPLSSHACHFCQAMVGILLLLGHRLSVQGLLYKKTEWQY